MIHYYLGEKTREQREDFARLFGVGANKEKWLTTDNYSVNIAASKGKITMIGSLTETESKVVETFVKGLKKLLGDNLVLLKLFGSKVHGGCSSESDIDILIVLKQENSHIRRVIFELVCEIDPYYEYKISPLIYSEYEYRKNEDLRSPFVETVKKEGLPL